MHNTMDEPQSIRFGKMIRKSDTDYGCHVCLVRVSPATVNHSHFPMSFVFPKVLLVHPNCTSLIYFNVVSFLLFLLCYDHTKVSRVFKFYTIIQCIGAFSVTPWISSQSWLVFDQPLQQLSRGVQVPFHYEMTSDKKIRYLEGSV